VARFLTDVVVAAAGAASEESTPSETPTSIETIDLNASHWAGTYRNGHLIFVLRESGGQLVFFDGSSELALDALEGSRVAARLPDGRVAITFDLFDDEAGRRYMYFRGLLYRHEADAL
jgi:hypothetical protein